MKAKPSRRSPNAPAAGARASQSHPPPFARLLRRCASERHRLSRSGLRRRVGVCRGRTSKLHSTFLLIVLERGGGTLSSSITAGDSPPHALCCLLGGLIACLSHPFTTPTTHTDARAHSNAPFFAGILSSDSISGAPSSSSGGPLKAIKVRGVVTLPGKRPTLLARSN